MTVQINRPLQAWLGENDTDIAAYLNQLNDANVSQFIRDCIRARMGQGTASAIADIRAALQIIEIEQLKKP